MLHSDDPLIFGPARGADFVQRVAACLNIAPGRCEEREFEGGEQKMRPLQSVHGRQVYVLHSLFGEPAASANDKLCRLLFFIGALRDAGAASITACVPYLAYARKDRRTRASDPITTKYVAAMFEAVRTDRVVVLEIHNDAAFDNAFRCETVRLDAGVIFADDLLPRVNAAHLVVASPDAGGIKRAERFRLHLERRTRQKIGSAFMEKFRSAGVLSGDRFIGEVEGAEVIVLDDLIASGETIMRTVR